MAAETYVISVYKRGKKPGKEVAGLAERTASGESKAFSSSGELWAFLSNAPSSRIEKTGRRRTARTKR